MDQEPLLPIPAPWQVRSSTVKPRWTRHQGNVTTCDDCTLDRANGTVRFPQMNARWKVQVGTQARLLCTVHAKRRWK